MTKMGHGTKAIGPIGLGKETHRQPENPPVNGPYFSPGLSGPYSKRAWVFEMVIGSVIVFIGLLFIVINPTLGSYHGSASIGMGIVTFGSLFILLGYCWKRNLKEREELRSDVLSVCGNTSIITMQPSMAGTIV